MPVQTFNSLDLQVARKSPVAQEALRRIGELYAIEADIRGRKPEERRQVRDERSRPLLKALKQWLEETLGKLSRKLDTSLAVRYALGRWKALMRYCDDGRLEIDNNAAEKALRAWHWAERTTFSQDLTAGAKAPRPSTA